MTEEDPRSTENLELEPEPEDFQPTPKKKGFLQQKPSLSSLNPVFFFFMLFLLLSLVYWTNDIRDQLWASQESIFVHKEYWRALTALFVHADLMHLLNNSILFLIFGWLLYYFYGGLAFPTASFVVGILTTISSAYFHDPRIRLLGASGMIYGMVAMWIVLYVKYDVEHSIPMRILRTLGFSLVILFPSTFYLEIDYIAHGIGFIYGLVMGVVLIPFLNSRVARFYTHEGKD